MTNVLEYLHLAFPLGCSATMPHTVSTLSTVLVVMYTYRKISSPWQRYYLVRRTSILVRDA